ncbi:MAG: hypothetical protein RLZ10_45 [Bacteroidota bacterium]|jgi:asparagine synthase (glutamine-hydrolysing)
MCGIFALIPSNGILRDEIIGMSESLSHRGPDSDGILLLNDVHDSSNINESNISLHNIESIKLLDNHFDSRLILGHRRLSIIDLSEAGHQPLSYLDRYWIVFNGEIYNYVEIRNELLKEGYMFSTNSDTEVILAAYHYWGEACQDEFNGMWAFIIYDNLNSSLFVSRDRFGVKPLYYYVSEVGLAFASEIKAFTVLNSWKFVANERIILDYLVWNIQDHTDETFFKGVFQFPQGSCIKFGLNLDDNILDFNGTKLLTKKWYSLEDKLNNCIATKPKTKMKDLLFSAVELQLRSDVKLGACLSGGIDSSSLVAIIGNKWDYRSSGSFNTITSGSVLKKFDEREFAKIINRAFNIEGNEIIVDDNNLFKDLDKILWHQDEPFCSTSTYAQFKVFEKAHRLGLKVMIDGQGSDEIFYGYPGFYGPYLASLIKKMRLLSLVRNVRDMHKKNNISLLKIFGYIFGYLFPSSIRIISRFDGKAFSDLSWLKEIHRKSTNFDLLSNFHARLSARHMSLAMIQHTNLPMLLHWEDRNSMAFSVEARVPFLDHRIVEFGYNLQDVLKINNGVTKIVLRDSMEGIVPDEILDRRDKMGFVTPESEWMKGDFMDTYRDELKQSINNFSSILDEKVLVMFDEYSLGRRPYNSIFWRIICLNRWFNLFKN